MAHFGKIFAFSYDHIANPHSEPLKLRREIRVLRARWPWTLQPSGAMVSKLATDGLVCDTNRNDETVGERKMNEVSSNHQASTTAGAQIRTRDWGKAMSDHVAYALLVYTALQIFMTVKALSAGFSSILPYVALVALVAAIIPACRWFEKRWTSLNAEQRADKSLTGAFWRDVALLWAIAILLPLGMTGICKAMF